jgi:hypothetical protein
MEVKTEPVLLGVNFLYRVIQYLRGDVPLSYLRDWQVDLRLNSKICNAAELYFLQVFEGRYAELTDFQPAEKHKGEAEEIFKRQLHALIGGLSPDGAQTGTTNHLITVGG